MKALAFLAGCLGILALAPVVESVDGCRYIKSRGSLSEYESGGPYALDSLVHTNGRSDLRAFLWKHWHEHNRGVAEAQVQTVDAGMVKLLFIIHPDANGNWGIDEESDAPAAQPCVAFHADSLIRLQIRRPDPNDPWKPSGTWTPDEIPSKRISDSAVLNPNLYEIVLVGNTKAVHEAI
jgi:hypothetical protein